VYNLDLWDYRTRDVRVGCGLERAKSVADDEDGSAEAAKGAMENARPGHKGAYAVETKPPHEDRLEAIMAEDPVGMTQRGERVGSEVGSLQA